MTAIATCLDAGLAHTWPGVPEYTARVLYKDSARPEETLWVPVRPEDVLDPHGYGVYLALKATLDPFFASVEWDEDVTDDGGALLELENEELDREVVFVIPDDGAHTFFYARDYEGFRLAGEVVSPMGIRHLAQWATGETDKVEHLGLLVGG